jgi:hypothetical protein
VAGMEKTREGLCSLINKVDICLKGNVISNEEVLKIEEQFLTEAYKDGREHKTLFIQHTGSDYYDAIAFAIAVISHLLIKQLSYECGYNIASLRERIYYMPEKDPETKMAGILIYTASGDAEGTLGGVVRQGREDCFTRIFKEAIEHAELCSNDPVCITSKGQGRESLNLASCHACGLIPETSCEIYNIMLDRGLVVGTFEEPRDGFYSDWINN